MLRIRNTVNTYSHLILIVGSDEAVEAPNSLLFATDVINQSIIDSIQKAVRALNNCLIIGGNAEMTIFE